MSRVGENGTREIHKKRLALGRLSRRQLLSVVSLGAWVAGLVKIVCQETIICEMKYCTD